MPERLPLLTSLAVLLTLAPLAQNRTSHAAEDAGTELLAPMTVEQVRTKARDWTRQRQVTDSEKLEAIKELWSQADSIQRPKELHRLTVRTFGIVVPEVASLLEQCRFNSRATPEVDFLSADEADSFYGSNLLAWVGIFLTQNELYDEALTHFEKVQPAHLVDPASFLFHRAVCEQQLLKAKAGLKTLKQLLQNTSDVPERYSEVAELMKADLEKLEEKSLDEVSRMMSDVERRLNLGRGGARVQKTEEEIVARLDELIKKLEQQQQQQQQQSSSQQGGNKSKVKPADRSTIKGSTAPGEVEQKEIGDKAGWGALPPKQQAKARNLIDRELPPHYRNAIEEYLRKLATRPASGSP